MKKYEGNKMTKKIDEHGKIIKAIKAVKSNNINESVRYVIEELLTEMANSDRLAVKNKTINLMFHLLKWSCQPRKRTRSWEVTLYNRRKELIRIFEMSKVLKNYQASNLVDWYPKAVDDALFEMNGNHEYELPERLPWTQHQLLDQTFYPETDTEKI